MIFRNNRISFLIRVTLLVLCQALCVTGQAQQPSPGETEPRADPKQAGETADAKGSRLPLDLAGYIGFRHLMNDELEERQTYREYSASLFVSKTVGRWRFHSEFNADTDPEYDSEGIHLFRRRPSLSVKLDNASLNYNWSDWFQTEAGFLFIPTYWRTHRYQSTTLTVDEPLVDQTVFPTAVKGVMIHGDKYLEDGGFSYQIYAGATQEADFDAHVQVIDRSRAEGAKLVFHLPTRHFFDSFDIGYQHLEEQYHHGAGERLHGAELLLEKGRARFLAEFARSSIEQPATSPYFRQGYYLQPSYRITPKVFAVVHYDWLNRDSRYSDESGLARESLGLVYRPIPALSLKVEVDRLEPRRGLVPAYYGASLAVVYFFRLQ